MVEFFVRRDSSEIQGCDHILEVGNNLITGEADFEESFAAPNSIEADLLLLAAAVFAADRATARGDREDVTRRIQLSIPVANLGRLLPLQQQIEQVLRSLSNDAWRIEFRQGAAEPETEFEPPEINGRTLLFSGGLDSLAAAVEFGEGDGGLQLVSHHTRNWRTRNAQRDLVDALDGHGFDLSLNQFFVSSRDGGPGGLEHDVEGSQRTRSFMFLVLGGLVARRQGSSEILFIAENGQLAVHLPLTHGRVGAFSTHTAHPDVLADMEVILSDALEHDIEIDNPYVHNTKAEVVETVVDRFPDLIPISQSCWRNARLGGEYDHCGECVPCLVRHIAIRTAHPGSNDPTEYRRCPWEEEFSGLDPEDTARRNLSDLAEFTELFSTLGEEAIMSEWPELYSSNIDAGGVIAMYRRSADETKEILESYPGVAPLLA